MRTTLWKEYFIYRRNIFKKEQIKDTFFSEESSATRNITSILSLSLSLLVEVRNFGYDIELYFLEAVLKQQLTVLLDFDYFVVCIAATSRYNLTNTRMLKSNLMDISGHCYPKHFKKH